MVEFNWFPTFSGRYLNFKSQHPFCQKKGTIIGFVDIAFRLSHPRYHKKKNFEFVINILLDNGYPLSLIFHVINERLKKLFLKTHDNNFNSFNNDTSNEEKCFYFNIPYLC